MVSKNFWGVLQPFPNLAHQLLLSVFVTDDWIPMFIISPPENTLPCKYVLRQQLYFYVKNVIVSKRFSLLLTLLLSWLLWQQDLRKYVWTTIVILSLRIFLHNMRDTKKGKQKGGILCIIFWEQILEWGSPAFIFRESSWLVLSRTPSRLDVVRSGLILSEHPLLNLEVHIPRWMLSRKFALHVPVHMWHIQTWN